MDEVKKLRAFCANCKGERNCEIKGHHRESGDEGPYDWWRNWYLLVCCGCDHVFAQSVFSDSESNFQIGYDHNGDAEYEHNETIRSWPARFKRPRPDWMNSLEHEVDHDRSSDLSACLFQVYEALDHDLNILAAIGIRTTFDVASEILGIDPTKPFIEKLKEMEDTTLITPSQKDDLEVLINAGNASAHRGWSPRFEDLDPLTGSLEDFLNDKFIIPSLRKKAAENVKKVRENVPKRQARSKASKKSEGDGSAVDLTAIVES